MHINENIAIERDCPIFIHKYNQCIILISILPCIHLSPIVHIIELMFCLFFFKLAIVIFLLATISNYQELINIYYVHLSTYEFLFHFFKTFTIKDDMGLSNFIKIIIATAQLVMIWVMPLLKICQKIIAIVASCHQIINYRSNQKHHRNVVGNSEEPVEVV